MLHNGLMPGTVRVPDAQEVRDFRTRLGIPADALVVGTLMRLVDEKDPDLWIDTAAEITKARPDIRFLIIGHGPLHGSILNRARRRGLSDRLVLAGSMSDVGLGYAALDVLLLTSSVEGLPNALVEAQAAGRPVVATDVGGTREAIDDGRTGLIVARDRPGCSPRQSCGFWAMRRSASGPAQKGRALPRSNLGMNGCFVKQWSCTGCRSSRRLGDVPCFRAERQRGRFL